MMATSGSARADRGERLCDRRGFTHDLHIRLQSEQLRDAESDDLVVIDHEDADHCGPPDSTMHLRECASVSSTVAGTAGRRALDRSHSFIGSPPDRRGATLTPTGEQLGVTTREAAASHGSS
jgi:hypothetical protein